MKPVPLFLRAMDSRRSHLARLVASRCLAARRFPLCRQVQVLSTRFAPHS